MAGASGLRRLLAGALVSMLALALAGCGKDAEPQPPAKARTPAVHLVEVVAATTAPVAHETVVTGSLKPRRKVRIFNQEAGRIAALPFFEGDRVGAGEVVARLDDALLQAELDKAVATRRQAELDLDRISRLARNKVASDDEVARARTALDVARAEEAVLRTRLGYFLIRAPFDGIVTERLVEPGDALSAHAQILTLVDPGSLVTELLVSELLLPDLAPGDPLEVAIDALGQGAFPGRIQRIHPVVDERTRRGIVEAALDPVPAQAQAGQFARVTLRTRPAERLLIPFAALRRDREGEFVFVVSDEGEARRRAVRSGLRFDRRVEVLSGLTDGERVVLRGFLGLSDGKAVEVVGAPAQGRLEPESGSIALETASPSTGPRPAP